MAQEKIVFKPSDTEKFRIGTAYNESKQQIRIVTSDGSGSSGGIYFRESGQQIHRIYPDNQYQYNTIGSSTPEWIWKQEGGSNNAVLNDNGLYLHQGTYRIGTTTVIDSSRNLTNIGNITSTGVLDISAGTTAIPVSISGSNSSYTSAAIKNTGSGDAILWFDASNGDLSGSDYASIRQTNGLNLLLKTEGSGGSILMQPAGTTALTLDTSQNATFAGDVLLADSKIIKLGTGLDLQIYHNGTNSFINNDTGDLFIKNFANDEDIVFQCDDGSGGVATYFQLDGSQAQSRFLRNVKWDDSIQAIFGGSDDLTIQHNGTDSKITNNTGDLFIRNNTDDGDIIFQSDNGSGSVAQYIRCDGGLGQVKLFHYGSEKFITTSAGVKVTGEVNLTGELEINGTDVIDSSRNLTNIGTISSTNITSNGSAVVVQSKPLTVLAQPLNISQPNGAEMKFFQTTGSTTASKGSIQWFDSGSNSCGTINLKANGSEDNSGVMEFYVTAETDELGDDPFGINKMMTITENGVQVHGSLSKSSGSFRIDHPLKPETHDLVHSFVEGPQADNLYRGKIELVDGRAVIDLDEWFGMTPGTFLALNRDLQAFVSNEEDWGCCQSQSNGLSAHYRVSECKI